MFVSRTHTPTNVMRRVEVVEIDDKGPIQTLTVQGLDDEFYKLPLRGQPFGVTGVPPVGSIGYLQIANGNIDEAFLSNIEHPEHRPKDKAAGETHLYGQAGNVVEMKADGTINIKSAGGVCHINPP